MRTLEKVGEHSMHITISVPDEMGKEINKQQGHNNLTLKDFENFLERYRQSLIQSSATINKKGKWVEFAKDIKQEKLLYGVGDDVKKASREIRDNFAFISDE